MKLLSLRQHNFRNLKQTKFIFDPFVTLIIGQNGQGKTNLLESIHLLLNGQSFRPAKYEHFVKKNENLAFIELELENQNRHYKVKLEFNNNKKRFLINEKVESSTKLRSLFPVVLFSPESLQSIKEGPEYRRSLIDEAMALIDRKSSQTLSEYNQVLKSKSKLLKDQNLQKMSKQEFEDVLYSLNSKLLPLATKLTHLRIQAIKSLQNEFQEAARRILNMPEGNFSIEYLVSESKALEWSEKEIYYALLNRLDELSRAERDARSVLVGPHRHDIQFLFDGVDARFYASQGQQRALILAFKMAQIMYHHKVHLSFPVLLLDDVLSELDPEKRNHLLSFLEQIKSQIILTTTDLDFKINFEKSKLTVFEIKEGEVSLE